MIEVEIKAKLDVEEALLEDMGFIKVSHVIEKDLYFNHPERDFRASDEALRIRIVKDSKGRKSSYITYKGKKLDGISMSRPEYETSIGDGETIKDILVSMGFKPVRPVIKERRYFDNGRLTVCMDDVDGLGRFIEIERTVESEDEKEQALAEVIACLNSLGGTMEDTTVKSYLSMLEDK